MSGREWEGVWEEEGFPRGNPSPAVPASDSPAFEDLPDEGAEFADGLGEPPLAEPYPEVEPAADDAWPADGERLVGRVPNLRGPGRGPKSKTRKLVAPQPVPQSAPSSEVAAERRLLILDTWRRSGLPAGDFAALVGVAKHTLYAWKKRFELEGPAGLVDRPRGAVKGSKLSDLTKRAILMLKQDNPEWGAQRISDMLLRGPALPASPSAVLRVLHEAGYQFEETPTKPHPDHPRRFERAKPGQLWQTDLFTFVLKRQNRRVYLVAFMDDHSRFITGYGLHASQSAALVLEVLRAAIASHGVPEEILTDNGTQYVTWRGKSAFAKELEQRGIRQVVASPRRPQTLGKIERFWGTLWRECVGTAVFLDLGEARTRIGHFIDHYNFQRSHKGCDGLVPADRYFGAAPDVLRTLKERVAANALELARNGVPKVPFYLTGNVGGRPFSVHAEGERVILTREGGRAEVDLVPPAAPAAPAEAGLPKPLVPDGSPTFGLPDESESAPPAPGVSPLDGFVSPGGEA